MPRELCSKKNLEKKQDALKDLRTTSHYPCDIKLFGKYPRTYNKEPPKITIVLEPELSDLGKLLAGL